MTTPKMIDPKDFNLTPEELELLVRGSQRWLGDGDIAERTIEDHAKDQQPDESGTES